MEKKATIPPACEPYDIFAPLKSVALNSFVNFFLLKGNMNCGGCVRFGQPNSRFTENAIYREMDDTAHAYGTSRNVLNYSNIYPADVVE